MLWFLKKNPPDKIFPRSYMDFEQKYQKDPGMNRVNATMGRPGWDSQQFFKGGVGTKRTTVASPASPWGNWNGLYYFLSQGHLRRLALLFSVSSVNQNLKENLHAVKKWSKSQNGPTKPQLRTQVPIFTLLAMLQQDVFPLSWPSSVLEVC